MVLMLSVHPSPMGDLVAPHSIAFAPPIAAREYRDDFHNVCTRVLAPPCRLTVATDFVIRDAGTPDEGAVEAEQVRVQDLPHEVLIYLLGSRYGDTDHLSNAAWSMFGHGPNGWARVQAICDYVHARLTRERRGTASASSAACAGISLTSRSRSAAA